MPRAKKQTAAPDVQDVRSDVRPAPDFSAHVFPPYRGEETHPDPSRLIVPISAVTRDPENARLHPERNLRHVRASLRRAARGQQTPIVVDRAGRILKGNGTHEAAELEGWKFIWIEVSNLEGAEATAYAVADNASGLSSQWDFKQLAENVRAVKDEFGGTELELSDDELCFEGHELSPLLNAEWKPPAVDEADVTPRQRGASRDPHPDLDEGDRADNCQPIAVTPNMRITIDLAVERVRLLSGDLSISEGRCLELVCADYLAGAPLPELTRDEIIDGDTGEQA
jgi:hypothetical protein